MIENREQNIEEKFKRDNIKNNFSFKENDENEKNSHNILKSNEISLTILKEKINNQFTKLKKNSQENFSIILNEDEDEEDNEENDENQFNYLEKIKPKGLNNLGGSCYMNATLQCFYHIKELTNFFLKHKKEIIKKKGLLSNGLLDVFEGLSSNNSSSYIPKKFKENLLEIDDVFEGTEGKDSGDLVQTILYVIQEELGGEPDLPDFTIDQRNESAMFIDLYFKNNLYKSIIMELFNFYIRIQSRCMNCGKCSYSISSENYLIFDLKQVFTLKNINKEKKGSLDSFRNVSIDDCLACYSFDGAESENSFCKICNKNTEIFSVRSFITLPKYLIMVMSRGEAEKFECHVEFEEEIDLKDSLQSIRGIPRETNTKYNLIAGTILYGSRGYGHTVAFCKHFDGKYYIFNDSSVKIACLNEIREQKLYLLFYSKNC